MDMVSLAYLLIAAGVVLVVAEMFFPTGFILVVAGVACALVGVGLLFTHGSSEQALLALLSLCVGGPLLGGFLFYLWPYSPMGRRVIRASEEGITVATMAGNAELEQLRGRTGKTVSPLRPSGVAEFDGRRIDVLTQGMMIEVGQWVRCVDVRGNRVFVVPAEAPARGEFEHPDFA